MYFVNARETMIFCVDTYESDQFFGNCDFSFLVILSFGTKTFQQATHKRQHRRGGRRSSRTFATDSRTPFAGGGGGVSVGGQMANFIRRASRSNSPPAGARTPTKTPPSPTNATDTEAALAPRRTGATASAVVDDTALLDLKSGAGVVAAGAGRRGGGGGGGGGPGDEIFGSREMWGGSSGRNSAERGSGDTAVLAVLALAAGGAAGGRGGGGDDDRRGKKKGPKEGVGQRRGHAGGSGGGGSGGGGGGGPGPSFT